MSGDRTGPQRTCVGCRRRDAASALVRVTAGARGVVVGGASDGRGAWLCRNEYGAPAADCVELALRRGGFVRAWRSDPRCFDAGAVRRAILGFGET